MPFLGPGAALKVSHESSIPSERKNRGHNRNNATSPKIKTVATLWTIRRLTSSWELIVYTTRIIGFFKFRYINVPFWKREFDSFSFDVTVWFFYISDSWQANSTQYKRTRFRKDSLSKHRLFSNSSLKAIIKGKNSFIQRRGVLRILTQDLLTVLNGNSN